MLSHRERPLTKPRWASMDQLAIDVVILRAMAVERILWRQRRKDRGLISAGALAFRARGSPHFLGSQKMRL